MKLSGGGSRASGTVKSATVPLGFENALPASFAPVTRPSMAPARLPKAAALVWRAKIP